MNTYEGIHSAKAICILSDSCAQNSLRIQFFIVFIAK